MRDVLKIFTVFTVSQKWEIVLIAIFMLFGAGIEVVGVGAVGPFIKLIEQTDFLTRSGFVGDMLLILGIKTHTEFIVLTGLIMILFYCFKSWFLTWQSKRQIDFVIKIQKFFAKELLSEYLREPYSFHLNNNSATLLRNVNSGVSTSFSLMLVPALQLITETVNIAVLLILIVAIEPVIACGIIITIGILLYVVVMGCRKKLFRYGEIQNFYSAEMNKVVNHSLGAIKETKISCRERFFIDEFENVYNKYASANGSYNVISQAQRYSIEAIALSGLLFLIIIKTVNGETVNEIVPFMATLTVAMFRLLPSVIKIMGSWTVIRFSSPVFNNLYEYFIRIKNREQLEEDKDIFCYPMNPLPFEKEIALKDISFKYLDTTEYIFSHISVTIPKGSFVGIVGPSGAGKTTFVNLLLGLYKPQNGLILVDGVDIFSDIRAWRKNIAYVPQDIFLMDTTLKANIALGVPSDKLDAQLIDKVIEMAGLRDFVTGLPEGGETVIGERGLKLSGGQRQRLGIARALYTEPNILVLDEATSALDTDTENEIMKTVLKLKGNITIIAIAHRVNTLGECDFKLECNNGNATVI